MNAARKPSNSTNAISYLYIVVSNAAVSRVLVKDDRGEQHPIFYTSQHMTDAETRYSTLEKMALAVMTSSRKLRPYFQSHSIVILTIEEYLGLEGGAKIQSLG